MFIPDVAPDIIRWKGWNGPILICFCLPIRVLRLAVALLHALCRVPRKYGGNSVLRKGSRSLYYSSGFVAKSRKCRAGRDATKRCSATPLAQRVTAVPDHLRCWHSSAMSWH